jgi:HTH-type transcriptional regulator/antitoxin HigA
MHATLILVDSDAELARAVRVLDRMMEANDPANAARVAAQARLIEAYEQTKWPARMPRPADVIRYLMDQHDLSRADMAPILGGASRVSEVLSGKKALSKSMVQRLRARFGVPADLLLPPVRKARGWRGAKRKAA